MAETKKTTATKKTTTTKKATTTTKKVAESKETEAPQLDLSSIPAELIEQLKASLLADIKKEVEVEPVSKKVEEPKEENQYTKAYLKKIQDDEYIQVKSVYDGTLNFSAFPNTNKEVRYRWDEKGAIETMTIREAMMIENQSKRFFHEPWLIPMDERFQVAYGLQDAVEVAEMIEDLDTFCSLDEAKIRQLVGKMNSGIKFTFRNELAIAISFGKISDYNKVRLFQKLFDIKQDDFVEDKYKNLLE